MRIFLAAFAVVCVFDLGHSHKTHYGPKLFIKLVNAKFEELVESDQRVLIVDPDDSKLTFEQNTILKNKGKVVLAYLSIGQAEPSRDYWKANWTVGTPDFLYRQDPKYEGGIVVKFWTPEWQNILLTYAANHIVPFGYSGVLIDYMDEYKNFVTELPNADQEMVTFGVRVADLLRSRNPQTLILTQDSTDLYRLKQYKDMVDGVSIEEAYHTHSRNDDGSLSYGTQSASYTQHQLAILEQVTKDKKVVMMLEYIEKNPDICEFYKKCVVSGYICGVFDLTVPGGSRECVVQKKFS